MNSGQPWDSLYRYFASHRAVMWGLLCTIIVGLVALVSRIEYKEQITDFLPVDDEYKQAMGIYQEVAAGNRIVLQFFGPEPDSIIGQVERFGETLAELDTAHLIIDGWQPQIDASAVLDVFSFVFEHLPIYLQDSDYARLDSLLSNQTVASDSTYIQHRLAWIRERLGMTSGSFMQPMLQNDPLGLGSRVAASLSAFQPEVSLAQVDGYMFTPDTSRCLVNLTTPYGSSETASNARLLTLFEQAAARSGADVRATGSPVIAVSNSGQIQQDSLLSAALSVVLILALLLWAFRSFKSLVYIFVTILFGFLFGLGILSLFHSSISLIVVGMTSIIMGIAVNYPLHFICHRQEGGDWRELVSPLLIGNVTTVGAFLALVPLDAVATRDLGLFAALMLVGTILFTLVFLPQLMGRIKIRPLDEGEGTVLGQSSPLVRRVLAGLILVITLVFGWFSLDTRFDTDLNNINYMTDEQRSDLALLSTLQGQHPGSATVYVATSHLADLEQKSPMLDSLQHAGAIASLKNPAALLPSRELQQQRLAQWQSFWQRMEHEGKFCYTSFVDQAVEAGFTAEAFSPFADLLSFTASDTCAAEDFTLLTETILTSLVQPATGQVVAQLSVPLDKVAEVEQLTGGFDLQSLNARVLGTLTDDFNYIGFACSFIVFVFLWISFGRIELAGLAFLPMIIGWLWILGLMQLLDIQFNIVNIILATFIFGQGDDYTIFVVEGLIRDYREAALTGRPVQSTLRSYQRSIMLSALIMFIGIGTLILAQHPAMHSLAEVTIIGMGVVVLMAWLVPPLLFDWLVAHDASLRRYILK